MKKIICILLCLLLCGCKNNKTIDIDSINNFNNDDAKEFDFDVHSPEYMLIRMSDLKIQYAKNTNNVIYPASLTKLATLDTVLNLVGDLNDVSYVTYEQVEQLIIEDASLAYIKRDYDYSILDLLYALILPSGADAAVALENYFTNKGMNLVEEINKHLKIIGCKNTNFVNTTGLHDDNHYTTLDDLFIVLVDILEFDEGRNILESMYHKMADGLFLTSSLRFIVDDDTQPLGGKTGFTPESGQSVIVLYRAHNRSYALMLANAMGDYKNKQYWHFEDAMEIMKRLY